MYTLQALWTQARESLNVTTVIFANRTYAILRHELANVGAQNVGRKALDMLDIGRPDLDFVALARGMGVPGEPRRDHGGVQCEVCRGREDRGTEPDRGRAVGETAPRLPHPFPCRRGCLGRQAHADG